MNQLAAVRGMLEIAERVVVITGAGMSAESGVPTFRGPDGLWRGFRAEELASPQAFASHPERVWEWYQWRAGLVRDASPHDGHTAIAALGRRKRVVVVTQNVDGLHQRAGSDDVIELHGSILKTRCSDLSCVNGGGDMPTRTGPPGRCSCGELIRPAVVWFGEALPGEALRRAEEVTVQSDVVLVVGTSSLVYPAAALPELALGTGAEVIEVNPVPTPLTEHVAIHLGGKAGAILPRLIGA